jgi:cation-transporting ATPase 13A3/4/5
LSTVPDELPDYLAWYEHQGYRALALATRPLDPSVSVQAAGTMSRDDVTMVEGRQGLILVAVLLLENVLREETSNVLNTVRAAGIESVMVTGEVWRRGFVSTGSDRNEF